jgi:predicted nucleotidyltransferase
MNVEEIKQKITPILKRYSVKRAGIFGSVARGEAEVDSDVDILVELPKGASLLDLVGLKIDLEGMLGNEVDVLTYNSIYPLLKERILSEEVAIL